jgi:hypothetical protein
MSLTKIQSLSTDEAAYLAGFLDADGCINAQLIHKHDYRLKFEIRITVTFYQKTKRHWFILGLHKKIGLGVVAKRKDGISTYTITGSSSVKSLLEVIYPYLTIKKKQAWYIFKIIEKNSKKMDPSLFIKLCLIVDKFGIFNDSKRRAVNTETVINVLKKNGYIFE